VTHFSNFVLARDIASPFNVEQFGKVFSANDNFTMQVRISYKNIPDGRRGFVPRRSEPTMRATVIQSQKDAAIYAPHFPVLVQRLNVFDADGFHGAAFDFCFHFSIS
jgi:hypothetical protein